MQNILQSIWCQGFLCLTVWFRNLGLETFSSIESIQILACKRFLNVSPKACNDAILGDLGRLPMHIYSSKRCIKYWIRLLSMPRHRYIRLCYEMLMHYDNIGHINWVTNIRKSLNSNGFGYVWASQSVDNTKIFLQLYTQRLTDQYRQTWVAKCN